MNHELTASYSVQVNVPAESGEMGILAQHVPSIEQLRPGLIEVIEESGGSKQFFREQADSWSILQHC
jgi:F0F1-type ATP synthase epsilon subunit